LSLPSFTIVTASLNSERTIAATLASVREQDYAGELEHVVVDAVGDLEHRRLAVHGHAVVADGDCRPPRRVAGRGRRAARSCVP
jgi:cellulose synthase/poly-beta-1,6-N-acetylglucosamine synthase-like glycosyltransferase